MVSRPIQIKHSVSSNDVPTLIPGELAFTQTGNNIFIGSPDGNSGNIRIGHKLNDGVLTANQALVANSTSGIDRIYASTIDTSNLNANSIISNQINTTNLISNTINSNNINVQNVNSNQIYTNAVSLNYLSVNGISGNSGYVLTSLGNNGVYWTSVLSLIGDIQISNTGTISTNNITVVGDMYSNSVISSNIISNTVTSNTINSNNIISNTINSNTVTSNNVISNNIISNIVTSNNVISNTVTSNTINSNNIYASGNAYSNNVVSNNVVVTGNVNSNTLNSNTLNVNYIIANGSPGQLKYVLTSSGQNGNVYWANSAAEPQAPYYVTTQMYDYTGYGIGWMNVAPNQNAETLGFRTDVSIPFGAIWILAINDGLIDPTPITVYSPSTRTTPMLWMSIDGTGPFDPDTNPHGQAYWFNITPPPSGA